VAGLGIFRALNFLAIEHFLDGAACARIRAGMESARSQSAQIGVEGALDERQRRSRVVAVSPDLHAEVADRLPAVRDRAAAHFGVRLAETEGPQFLRYRPGDFFIRHMDRDRDGGNRRQVSFIAFVNSDFEGGALKFGGLENGVELTLPPADGLLIGFRSDWIHAVEPVTRGERCTIVGWFA
jgi:predicted 2-oxoglutarate/Fe(II)-dependent dioxygenase YbiX